MMGHSHRADEYENIAQIYDTVLGPLLMPIRKEICRIVQSQSFDNIIDICCGTGQQCIMLANLGYRISGIDLSTGMLDVARRQSPRAINFYRANATDLPFADKTFDCAILSFSLHEKDEDERQQILTEAARVLTPAGKMLLVDYLSPFHLSSAMGGVVIDMVERLAGKVHHNNYRNYMKQGALESLLERRHLVPEFVKKFHLGTTGLALVESHPWSCTQGASISSARNPRTPRLARKGIEATPRIMMDRVLSPAATR